MADYYSHRDSRPKGEQHLDYDTGSGVGWVWGIVVLLALVALIALGSGGGSDSTTDGATPAAAVDDSSIETAPAAPTSAPAINE